VTEKSNGDATVEPNGVPVGVDSETSSSAQVRSQSSCLPLHYVHYSSLQLRFGDLDADYVTSFNPATKDQTQVRQKTTIVIPSDLILRSSLVFLCFARTLYPMLSLHIYRASHLYT
jgi:hypothetical protein